MSIITTLATLSHQDTRATFTKSYNRTANSDSLSSGSKTVLTVDETVDIGDIVTARNIYLNLLSGDDCRIGLDGSTYPFRLSANEPMLLRLDVEGLVETQTVTTVADVAASLNAKYLTLTGNSGTWAIWIDVDDSGTAEPAHGQDSSVEVTGVVTGDTAAAVALAVFDALSDSTAFLLDFTVAYNATTDDDFITITDKHTGTRTDIADTGTTGFTVATTQQGAASPVIHLKSAGTSQVAYAVAPQ